MREKTSFVLIVATSARTSPRSQGPVSGTARGHVLHSPERLSRRRFALGHSRTGGLITARCWLRSVDDNDRAGGVMDALLAHRAEQDVGEAAVPARPYDQEIIRGDSADQDFGGGALDHLSVDESKIMVEAELLDVAGLEQHDDLIGRSASDPAGRSFADIVQEDFHASTPSGPLLKW